MNKAIPAFLIRHARAVCLLFLVFIAVCGWMTRLFEIDASAETLLVKDNRLYLETRKYNQRFAPEEFILVGYRPHANDLFSDATLRTLQTMVRDISALDRVEKVNAITNVPLIAAVSSLSFDEELSAASWSSSNFSRETLREIFTDHPVYTDLLVNSDLTATALQIVFKPNEELRETDRQLLDLQFMALDMPLDADRKATLEELEARKEQLQGELETTRNREIELLYRLLEPYAMNAEIYLGGNHVLAYHLVEIITSDLVLFGIAIALVISVLLLAIFRDWRWLLLPLLCCLCGVVITTGMFGALGLKTTVISSNFIALQLILTLAIVIHLIVHYQHLAENHRDMDHRELLATTVAEKASPCFFAGVTTGVGFAALLFSNLQPVIAFGWMMIVAMATSIVTSLVLFPAVLALFPGKPRCGHPRMVQHMLEWLSGFCANRPVLITLTILLLTGIAGAGIFRLESENSFINYFSKDTRVYQELIFIDRELGGSTPLDIIYHPQGADNESEDLVLEAGRARELQSIQLSLQSSAAVGKIMSAFNFTELARQLNDQQPLTEYELNSLYTILDRDLRENLLGAYVDEENNTYRINVRIMDSTPGLDRKAFLASTHSALQQMDIDEADYTLTNLFVLYQDILERLVDSQINTIALVFAALWLVMLLIFRSPLVALIALVPNVVVTLFILGVMGWLGIPLDLMTVTIAAIAMGIAVDDTIHFIHHYLEAGDNPDPLRQTFMTVGYALLYTSLIIAAGFSMLGFSDFVPSIVFGLLTSVTMLVALLCSITLLPVLLVHTVRRVT